MSRPGLGLRPRRRFCRCEAGSAGGRRGRWDPRSWGIRLRVGSSLERQSSNGAPGSKHGSHRQQHVVPFHHTFHTHTAQLKQHFAHARRQWRREAPPYAPPLSGNLSQNGYGVPRFLAAGVRRAFVHALRGLHSPNPAAGITAERAWKLFLLVPRLLLIRTRETGPAGRTALLQRLQAFEAGRWCELLDAAMPSTAQPQRSPGSDVERMTERACAQVRRGELSRARQTLTSAPLAPSNADTLRLLSDPDKRPPHPRHPIPDDMVRFRAANPLRLRAPELVEVLRMAKRGSAAGLSGASVEHCRLLLEDEEALDLLAHAASLLANADAPADVLRALALSQPTALSKPGKGVRGIATGDTLRLLVSRTLTRRYAETFDRATRPFQFALQARAGTDCLAAMLRAASELDADATIVSLDGRSAGVPRCLPYEAA